MVDTFNQCVKIIKEMGIKVILASGKPKDEAVNFAQKTGILSDSNPNNQIIAGCELSERTNTDFEVVFESTKEERVKLVEFLKS